MRTDANVSSSLQDSSIVMDNQSNRLETDLALPSIKNKAILYESKNIDTSKVQTTQIELQGKLGSQDDACKICFEKFFDSVFFPCGHCSACFVCSLKLLRSSGTCPLCRSEVREIIRINAVNSIYSIVEVLESVDGSNIGYYIELLSYIDSLKETS